MVHQATGSGDEFGCSVSISEDGNTALIGSFGRDDLGTDSGAAYIFTRNEEGNWSEHQKLLASDGGEFDNFGWSVALSKDGRMALIGTPGDDDLGADAGAAYIFARS